VIAWDEIAAKVQSERSASSLRPFGVGEYSELNPLRASFSIGSDQTVCARVVDVIYAKRFPPAANRFAVYAPPV